MKKNYELELYKLIMHPEEDDPDFQYVDEFGWINNDEFCVWISHRVWNDFMDQFKKIFGLEISDDGGIAAQIQEDDICFDLQAAVEPYGVNIEEVFPKNKYEH